MIDYEKYFNNSITSIKPSGIRKFFDIANEMDDVISLSIGEPDFQTPWHIRDEGINSLEKGKTWYSPNRGFSELCDEICIYYNRRFGISYDSKSQVLVTVCGSESIDIAFHTLVEKGDEVIIPEPSFVCYEPLTVMAGGTPVIIKTKNAENFMLKARDLEHALTAKTK
ncbi:MAG: aminotransferase class I/II-fold pyridoxal phosphate-dependent enzyme [Clostridiales bacterium]|nr:aminotransferase class I/II-fold pyridoxal phosphate-dependent enzyme [Clostridiales bacterium]